MRILRKIGIWTFVVLIFLMGSGIFLAWLFEDEIHLYAIRELGKKLNARIEVRETELSFFKSFPKVDIELKDLRINAEESTDTDDFIFVESAHFKVNFWSFFSQRYEIAGVVLDHPEVRMIHRKKEGWNFGSVFQPDTTLNAGQEASELIFELRNVRFVQGKYIYVDEIEGNSLRLDSLDLGLSGDLGTSNSDVELDFRFFFDHWKSGNMKYIDRRWVNADLELLADYGEFAEFAIRSAKVRLASLALDVTGSVRQSDNHVNLDLEFVTNENSFESFLALLPGKWLLTDRPYEYGGDFAMEGWVRGPLGPQLVPDCFADYSVRRGNFQYTGYRSKVTEANVKGAFLYKPTLPQMSYFRVDQLHALLNGKKVHGDLKYEDFSDPSLDFKAFGEILLQDIRDFYPAFADSTELFGKVFADIAAKGKISDFKNRKYAAITATGSMNLDSVSIRNNHLQQPVRELGGHIRVDNSQIHVLSLFGKLGSSDFDITGKITQYLPRFFSDAEPIVARVKLQSDHLDLNEWIREKGPVPGAVAEQDQVYDLSMPDWLNLEADARVGHFALANFRADSLTGMVSMKNNRFIVPDLRMQTLGGSVAAVFKMLVESPEHALVQVTTEAHGVDINRTLKTFDQLAAFALVEDNLSGIFTGNMTVSGILDKRLRLNEETIISFGNYEIRDGRLVNFKPLEGLAGFVKLEKLRDIHFSDVQSTYRVEDQFVYLPDLDVVANEYKLHVSGRHGFDNSLDYRVSVELPRKEAKSSRSSEVQEWINEDEGESIRVIIPIKVTGTVDNPKFSLDGNYVRNSVREELKSQKEELEEALRTESEEYFGKQDNTNVDDWIVEEDPDSAKKAVSIFKKLKNPFKKLRDPSLD